uniref:Leukocyte receptor cluster member 8 n=1 Tax=Anthurium amnicola TaxID=1678845 RepID=A0A1D1YV28_9ARAE
MAPLIMVYPQFLATMMISKQKIQLLFRMEQMWHLTPPMFQVWERQVQLMTIMLIFQVKILLTLMHMHIKIITMVISSHLMILFNIKWEQFKIQTTAGYQPAAAGYQSSDYSHQTNLWNDGNYAPHHHSTYALPDVNAGHCSSNVTVDPSNYQQHYSQWASYYSQTASAVICAPGTEHTPRTSVPVECPIPDFNGGYATVNSQPPPPGTTSWRQESISSGLPSLQGTNDAVGYSQNSAWQNGPLVFGNHQPSQATSHFQKPLDSTPLPCASVEDQQQAIYTLGSNAQFPLHVPQNFQPPLQQASTLDTLRVSKMQIPTNPRIATNLSISKMDKESSTIDGTPKPAYVNVSLSKPSNEVSSHDSAGGIMKQGTFPLSLRAYVERSFARCKDDEQRLSNQNTMKEIITKASADGTLYTRDWDTEPLFPLPSTSLDAVNKDSVNKFKRSPTRRTKSRWEPVAEEKMAEKPSPVIHISSGVAKYENKVNGWNSVTFLASQQTLANKNIQRPMKKQRFGDSDATEDGDGSGDSDKEQNLTKYYSSALALAHSPEERKRREHRHRRFEKGQERQGELKNYQPKGIRAAGLYNRRASVSLLSKYEDGSSQAVEDIDWDSFTVKGTCQEIEKRYLRLTSAPDPATVRPEEVLEKALTMVQISSKNYLYKCDQLKSIRQDLTVQRIRNELTVKVYETHARLALEAGDMPEFNQCQSQLKSLYAEGIKGCHFEFSAYNLLCVILHSSNNRELLSSMARLSAEAKKDEAVKHALAVRAAVTSGNYVLFFRLYKKAPNLSTCLMDLYLEKMRFEAVKCMSKSYRPTVPVSFIAQVLGFVRVVLTEETEGKEAYGVEECEEWLKAHGAIITVDNNGEMLLDAKGTSACLYMPEPDDAVAHGDSNLAVDDFLARAP